MKPDLYSKEAYLYDLPNELIAQHPTEKRDESRLLLVDRKTGNLEEMPFKELTSFLQPGDSLVLNDTKVIPARLLGKRSTLGNAEIFLLKRLSLDTWEALAKPGKKLKVGSEVFFAEDFKCQIIETTSEGNKIVKFFWNGNFEERLAQYGLMPLPHYIHRTESEIFDEKRYQTVFAKNSGAVAAPTAGLHFSHEMLEELRLKGIEQNSVTLHVGLGTFRPVQTEDIRLHPMHSEHFVIDESVAEKLNQRDKNKLQICVGTTSCRALESACNENGLIVPGSYETSIFIYPGYSFKYVQALLTNFHLPGSTLLMLVSAFAGYELIREAYQKAIKDRFRFFSYGDAMLIV
ncbi:MAG: tRNA preQ1(34) S-adenosylmethionine ribosyltransferase-isomerase QueA [Parachlamydiaceae bacterium]|nr:tRNA preQ1(34) S-adenosylmethionine ribosyltransferase-isomerase QueA [Parachlamydiaceae bacterium]